MTRLDVLHRTIRRRLKSACGDSGVGGNGRDDRGMSAIEFVFLTPILFFVIFVTVQFGLYFFADHVAQAAAQAGARKARAEADQDRSGWAGKAKDTADSYIQQLGPNLLVGPTVRAFGNPTGSVGVQVTARVPTVFPGMSFSVDETSEGPVERFVSDRG